MTKEKDWEKGGAVPNRRLPVILYNHEIIGIHPYDNKNCCPSIKIDVVDCNLEEDMQALKEKLEHLKS